MEHVYRWLIAIAFVISLFSLAMVVNLSKTIVNLEDKIQELSDRFDTRLRDIYERLTVISANIRNIEWNISDLNVSIADLYNRVNNLYNRTENLSKTLDVISTDQKYILNWLETSTKEVEPYIKAMINDPRVSQCKKGNVFDIACFSYYLYFIYGVDYIEDINVYGKDTLLKPTTFLRKRSGDCEDYAYFYYSLLKYLKEKGYYLKFPEADFMSRYYLYETREDIYYLMDMKENQIDLRNKDIYVVCWSWVVDYSKEEGHCAIAICPSGIEIKYMNTIDQFLTWCYIIEPQYYGARYKKYKYCTRGFYTYCIDMPFYNNYIAVNFDKGYKLEGVFLYFNDSKVCYYASDDRWRCFQR